VVDQAQVSTYRARIVIKRVAIVFDMFVCSVKFSGLKQCVMRGDLL
jgi:hypothetical protein